ncbi:predicted protein [Postia placenta Mad-698-R]|nr:predicted protein [Postia placenta Mad-698-R]
MFGYNPYGDYSNPYAYSRAAPVYSPDQDYLQALADERAAREQYFAARRAQEEARERAARARAARQAYAPYNSYYFDDDDGTHEDNDSYDGAYSASPYGSYGYAAEAHTALDAQPQTSAETSMEVERTSPAQPQSDCSPESPDTAIVEEVEDKDAEPPMSAEPHTQLFDDSERMDEAPDETTIEVIEAEPEPPEDEDEIKADLLEDGEKMQVEPATVEADFTFERLPAPDKDIPFTPALPNSAPSLEEAPPTPEIDVVDESAPAVLATLPQTRTDDETCPPPPDADIPDAPSEDREPDVLRGEHHPARSPSDVSGTSQSCPTADVDASPDAAVHFHPMISGFVEPAHHSSGSGKPPAPADDPDVAAVFAHIERRTPEQTRLWMERTQTQTHQECPLTIPRIDPPGRWYPICISKNNDDNGHIT